jgi:hypothetical protein
MKLVRLIKMCLHETYSEGLIGKYLSDSFPVENGLKQGDAISPDISFWLMPIIRIYWEITQML